MLITSFWKHLPELDLIDMTDEIQKKTGIRVKLTNRQLQHMFSTSQNIAQMEAFQAAFSEMVLEKSIPAANGTVCC